jgi:hypothetical protein
MAATQMVHCRIKVKPRSATGDWGTFPFKCPFLHLLILFIVFLTFLNLITSDKNRKKESIYFFHKLEENSPLLTKLI